MQTGLHCSIHWPRAIGKLRRFEWPWFGVPVRWHAWSHCPGPGNMRAQSQVRLNKFLCFHNPHIHSDFILSSLDTTATRTPWKSTRAYFMGLPKIRWILEALAGTWNGMLTTWGISFRCRILKNNEWIWLSQEVLAMHQEGFTPNHLPSIPWKKKKTAQKHHVS